MPGVRDGGWGYAIVAGRTIYLAHGDLIPESILARLISRALGHFVHAHALVPIPDNQRLLLTSGGDATVRILDKVSGKKSARIRVDASSDAAIVDAATATCWS